MKIDFSGKVVIVTGGASGIGRRVAEAFSESGAMVLSADISNKNAGTSSQTWKGISNARLDVRNDAACNALVANVIAAAGHIDFLVNCAGIAERIRTTANQDTAHWEEIIDINLGGTYRMSKAVASAMSKNGTKGAIVNVGSLMGLRGFRAANGYGVSKSAVIMLTQTMAIDLAPQGIRVNAVAPGFISTPMIEFIETAERPSKQNYLQRIPMNRFGLADEVAQPILMLCSDLASYITGVVVPIDGGWAAFGGV